MVGVDGKIHDTWVVGTFFDYENTSVDLDNQGSTASINSYTGGLYAGYHNGGYYANGLFAYTRNDYTSQRNIVIPGFGTAADGSTNGNQEELNLDGGYDFHLNDHVTWGPIAGLQYVHLNVDSFNETGAPAANLAVGSQDLDSLRSRLGVRIEYRKQVRKQMEFSTELHAEWQHEFLDNSQGISASFIGDGLVPFSVQTTSPERDAALVGVGADLTVRDKWTLFFDYDVQAGQQDYLEQSIKGGVKLSW
jgi:outer membrane lipase/esterase